MYSPLNEYACLEYLTGGTLKGEADFVTAKVKPTGRKYELQCCFVFHFNAQGLIDKVHEYFDMATVDGLHRLPSRRSMERERRVRPNEALQLTTDQKYEEVISYQFSGRKLAPASGG